MSPEWEAIGKLKSKDYLNCASSLKVHLSWLILEQTKDLKKKKKNNAEETHGDSLVPVKNTTTHLPVGWVILVIIQQTFWGKVQMWTGASNFESIFIGRDLFSF